MMKSAALMILIAILVSACGELAYKRGASVAQLENARQTCQSENTAIAITKCMEDQGWVTHRLDSFEMLTELPIKTDAEINAPDNDLESKQNPAFESKQTIDAAPKNTTTTTHSQHQNKIIAVNPLDTFVVSTWWKTGAKADTFQVDRDLCVQKLGEQHKPNDRTQLATAGFIVCMGEQGWKSLRKIK